LKNTVYSTYKHLTEIFNQAGLPASLLSAIKTLKSNSKPTKEEIKRFKKGRRFLIHYARILLRPHKSKKHSRKNSLKKKQKC